MHHVEPELAVGDHSAFCTRICPQQVGYSSIDFDGVEELSDDANLYLIAVANVPPDDLAAVCIHGPIDLNSEAQ